jgi:hypothetical protein
MIHEIQSLPVSAIMSACDVEIRRAASSRHVMVVSTKKDRAFRQWFVVSPEKIEPSDTGLSCHQKKLSLPTMVCRVTEKN